PSSKLSPKILGYVARRDLLSPGEMLFVDSRHFSPETLKLSVLGSPGARQAKVGEGN
ncbi:hypothetical protein A2U01_0039784, partial [Trifolium medium]|nr:hypothetical protein [Trifolium medium]